MILFAQANPFADALQTVADFLPRFLGFLAILVIGSIVAKAIANLLNKVLERVGFDRAVERGGVHKALARSQYDPSDILSQLVCSTRCSCSCSRWRSACSETTR